jgi:esterase/lipase
MRTQGLFQNDPERLKVVKSPGEHQLMNYRDLLRVNETIKNYYEKVELQEEKKLKNVKESRITMNEEVKRTMAKVEQRFLKQVRAAVRA